MFRYAIMAIGLVFTSVELVKAQEYLQHVADLLSHVH